MRLPAFPEIDTALLELSADRSFERFAAACRTIYGTLGLTHLKSFIEADLARIISGERGYDALSRPHYVLADTAESEVNAVVLDVGAVNGPDPLVLARDSAFGVLHGGPVELRVHRSPRALHEDRIEPGERLEEAQSVTLGPGEYLAAERLTTASEPVYVETSAVCVRVYGPIRTAFNIALDRETRRPKRLVNALDRLSRIESALRVIAKTAPDAGLGVADELRMHPVHTVRWAATQIVCTADPSSAERLLHELSSDPHPQIRHAALARLRLLDKEDSLGRS